MIDNQLTYNADTNVLIVGSDERWKDNIQIIENPLEKVQQLRGVTYEWKDSGERTYGLIAQEVEKVLPELVDTDEEGYKGVGYQNMVSVLIEFVKEQQTQIDALKRLRLTSCLNRSDRFISRDQVDTIVRDPNGIKYPF